MPSLGFIEDKDSQTALEYLLTYGWAITIVILVVALIYSFGILNAPATAPVISGFPGVVVTAAQANTSVFKFSIENDLGIQANLSALSASFNGNIYTSWQCTATVLDPGENSVCTIKGGFPTYRIQAYVVINYSASSILNGTSSGIISITP